MSRLDTAEEGDSGDAPRDAGQRPGPAVAAGRYWCKGATSGDRQHVRELRYDCDGDTLLGLVEQAGRGACHTGEWSCFHRALGR